MQSLQISDGEILMVENTMLPHGKYVKIEPQSVDFLDIHDPRAVLENAFRNYSTLTLGDTISFLYNEKVYDIRILDVKPSDAVIIIETDLEVEFAPPVGYVEKTSTGSFKELAMQHTENQLGYKTSNRKQEITFDSILLGKPMPLRLPLGTFFFGYPVIPN